jgi:adenylate cyclase class 2
MNIEYEAKFLNIDIDSIRDLLKKHNGNLVKPMALMKRTIFENDEMRKNDAFIRVRDEGDKITVTYKMFSDLSVDGAKEIEMNVSNFDAAVQILSKLDLNLKSIQESKREVWKIEDVEIVIDVWPWLNPYVEIEGDSEDAVRKIADELGLKWSDALFGDVMAAYRNQYSHLNKEQTIGDLKVVRFKDPIPEMLKN